MIRDWATAAAMFVVATVLAELLGAVNMGTAMTFGAIAFMATIVALILVRGPEREPEPPEARRPSRAKAPLPSARPAKRRRR